MAREKLNKLRNDLNLSFWLSQFLFRIKWKWKWFVSLSALFKFAASWLFNRSSSLPCSPIHSEKGSKKACFDFDDDHSRQTSSIRLAQFKVRNTFFKHVKIVCCSLGEWEQKNRETAENPMWHCLVRIIPLFVWQVFFLLVAHLNGN